MSVALYTPIGHMNIPNSSHQHVVFGTGFETSSTTDCDFVFAIRATKRPLQGPLEPRGAGNSSTERQKNQRKANLKSWVQVWFNKKMGHRQKMKNLAKFWKSLKK